MPAETLQDQVHIDRWCRFSEIFGNMMANVSRAEQFTGKNRIDIFFNGIKHFAFLRAPGLLCLFIRPLDFAKHHIMHINYYQFINCKEMYA